MTMTVDTQAEVSTAPEFAITLPASELVTAVKNVAPFASTDTTLPALTGISFELAADGTLTLAATDRYALAVTHIEIGDRELASHAGEGSAFISAADCKTLASVKARGSYELITLTVAQDGTVTVALPDTRVLTWPASATRRASSTLTRKAR